MDKRIIVLYLLLITIISIFAFTNLGRDFYFCYPANACREPVGLPVPPASDFNGQIILTSTWATNGTVRNIDGSFSVPFFIPPNSVTTVSVDSTFWLRESELIEQKGLRIQADNPISAYFLSYEAPGSTNDMALLYPIPSLGTEYITMCWRDNLPTAPSALIPPYNRGPSMFAIVAPYDSTEVTITPSVITEDGRPAGVPWTITLDSYETYQVLANSPSLTNLYDLTGSEITSNKPISVIAGNQIAFMPDSIMAADYLIEQIPPISAWGKNFNAFPIQPRNYWEKDVIRIVASEDATSISIQDDGGTTTFSLDRGEFWEWNGQPCEPGSWLFEGSCDGDLLDSPTRIEADKPVLVGQFLMGGTMVSYTDILGSYTDPLGDPAFMLVAPAEQYSSRYVFLTPSGYNNDFLNVAIEVGYEGTITLDGMAPTFSTTWFNIPGTTYRGARIELDPGGHVLEADTTMLIQMYGYDSNWASYAAVAGQNLNPINAEYQAIKYCTYTPTMSGTYTTWRIVIIQNAGDPGHNIQVVDTLPPGFSMGSTPATISLFGTATRDSVMDPSPGDTVLNWGWFSTTEGDSIVIEFEASIEMGVEGIFDNPVEVYGDSGLGGHNAGGLLGDQDDVMVILPVFPIADAGWDTTICVGTSATIGGSPTADAGTPPLSVDWSSIPPGYSSSSWNPTVFPTEPTWYIATVTDSNGFTDADTCFVNLAPSPFAYVQIPDPCGLVTTCANQEIQWIVVDTVTGLLFDSTVVSINGTFYTPGTELTQTSVGAGTTLVTFTPSTDWSHGDTISAELIQAMNSAYCAVSVEPCTFIVDLQPPIITDTIPTADTTVYDSIPDIRLPIEDFPAGVDPASFNYITISVDGVVISDWAPSWDGSELTISGHVFQNGDTVRICLDSLFDAPGYSYCPPNDTSMCWDFYVMISTPEAHLIEPVDVNLDGVVASACTCQPIIYYLADDIGIDESTIRFEYDGTAIDIGDSRLSYLYDSLLIFQPEPPCWFDGITYDFRLLEAENMAGIGLPAPITGDMLIDLSPPYFDNILPAPGSDVGGSPNVSIQVHDDGIGVDEDDVYITIEGITFAPPTAGLTWDGTTFTANLSTLGLSYSDGDTIDFCLMGAHDNPDYCDSNYADTCWSLIVNLSVPTGSVILPSPGAISACDYQGVYWHVEASNGIDAATAVVIDGSASYTISSPELDYIPLTAGSGEFRFEPTMPWGTYDTLNICLTELADSMGHIMPDSICVEFFMDLEAPTMYGLTPLPGTESASTSPAIYFCLRDRVAGVDGDSIILNVDGVDYPFVGGWIEWDTCLTWNAVDYSLEFSEGDTIDICLHAADHPDTCAANYMDSCWTLIMPPPHVYAHAGVDINLCPGDSVQLGCTPSAYAGSPPYTYEWTEVGGSWTSSESNPYAIPTVTTDYVLHVTDDAPTPTEDYDTVTITVDFVAVGSPTLISPASGALLPPSPSTIDLVWNASSGTGTIVYDVLIDGVPVALNIADTSYTVDYPCEESHTWTIIAKNTCATEYFFCEVDTLGDSTYIYLGVADTHYAVSSDSGRIFNTYPCGGPVPEAIRPLDGTFTACDPESIVIEINDTASIIESTIVLQIEGTDYTTANPELTFYVPNTLIFSPGAGFWSDGDVVDVTLLHAENRFGVDIASPYTFTFTVDYSPPTFSGVYPAAGGWVPGTFTTAGFYTEDALSGVDPSEVCIIVDGAGVYDTWCVGDTCVTYDTIAGNFELDLECAGYDFDRGDTITFCAVAGDSPDYCEANVDTSCWDIYVIDCDLMIDIDIPDTIFCGIDSISMVMTSTLSGGTPPYSYSWWPTPLYDDPTSPLPTISLAGPGADYIGVTVTDSTGCIWSDSIFVGISNPIAHAGGDITICPGGTGTVGCDPLITGSVIPPIDTIWYDLDGTVVHTGGPFDVTPDSSIYYVLEIVDSIGCSDIDTMWVNYEHEAPGSFSWVIPDSADTVTPGMVELCWEMPPGTAPIYFEVFVDSVSMVSGITDTCFSVGPYPCGEYHTWYIESWNYCYPVACDGSMDSSATVVAGSTFADGFDPPFWTDPCPTGEPIIIEPFDLTWSACDDQQIILKIGLPDSGLALDPATFRFEVEGSVYVVDGTVLMWDGDSILTYDPWQTWTDGQEVNVVLDSALDLDSNSVNNLPFEWLFYVDLTPPVASVVSPPLVEVTSSPGTFEFDVTDDGCGIAVDSFAVLVGDNSGLTLYPIDGAILSWSNPVLTFDASAAGESWTAGDSIIIEVIAADNPDYCAANCDTTHFAWFFRDPNAPLPEIIRPEDGDFTACDPDSIVIQITDSDGIDESTIELEVNGTSYFESDTELEWDDPYLVYRPDPMWATATDVHVRLLHVEDIFGNDITSILDYNFVVDYDEPTADMTLPLGMTRDLQQDVIIEIEDPLSGVDSMLLEMVVEGVTYNIADFTWAPNTEGGGILGFAPENHDVEFVQGDTVDVILRVYDSPDWCDPNEGIYEWQFLIEPKVNCAVFPNPFTPNSDDINDRTYFTYPNMMSEPALIIIYDMRNVEIWRADIPAQTDFGDAVGRIWDGRDNESNPVKQGLYLYVIKVDGEIMCNGTILLLR